jgi:hypothetical protein
MRVTVAERRWRPAAQAQLEELLAGLGWALWRWRIELLAFAFVAIAILALARPLGPTGATVAAAAGVAAALASGRTRRAAFGVFRRARVRRGWERAVVDAGLAAHPLAAPRALSLVRMAAGDQLRVRVPRGQSVAALEERREELAACLRVREVRVLRERADAAEARVLLVRRDPFDDVSHLPWPVTDACDVSLWDPVPVGVDEEGSVVSISLPERNVLLGGEPGAGKSAALSVLVASAALDTSARVWLLDGKLVELAAWAPVAQRIVGTDADDAISLLREVQAEMDARYRELLARGLRKVGREEGLPLHLVVCDELAFYLSLSDKRERQEFTELLRDLVARGRAAGVIVCAATQKPGSDVVPTALRDLFGFRLALRCNTPQASDTILGQGWASAGADASTIPGGQRGVGYLLTEGERPIRTKGFYLADDDVRAIAEHAAARRADAWLAAASGDQADRQAAGGE